MQWVNNPQMMTRFKKEELEEMNKELIELRRSFIEYDLEVTKKGGEKGLKAGKMLKGEEEKEKGFFTFNLVNDVAGKQDRRRVLTVR